MIKVSETRSALRRLALTKVAAGTSTDGILTRLVNSASDLRDRVGSAAGTAYQRLKDDIRTARRNDALDTEAFNAYNKVWHKFAPAHTAENFSRFKQLYLREKTRSAATRLPPRDIAGTGAFSTAKAKMPGNGALRAVGGKLGVRPVSNPVAAGIR